MRIIAGSSRGIQLNTPKEDMPVRPTTDRVKESMFSSIQFDIRGNVLDLFAGTGQLGLESLSRGAEYCVFCDKNPDCIKIIKSNVSKTKNEKKSRIIQVDYKRFIKHDCIMKFDVVFLDPPYNTGLSDKALNYLSTGEHLNEGCIVVLECEASEKKPETSGVLKLRKRYTLSGVSYLVYVKSDE